MGNEFRGVNEVIPTRGFNYRHLAVADYHKSHPGQPIIGTEMASTLTTRGIYLKDTIRCYVPDEDITAPPWGSKAEEWWTLCAGQPWWMGGFVWTGFDYRGEPTPYQWPNINSHFGLMDVCGFPKNVYYYYQSWWTDKDVLHISPHWNWHGQEGKPIRVWVNSNADNVELFLNGKGLGKKVMKRNSHLEWDVPYQPGILKAIAYKNGRRITSQVETTGEANKIVLVSDMKNIRSDGLGASVINVSVVDKEGREVPDAGNLIRFKVKGDATIIGVGNGDPDSHEADKCLGNSWQRKLFNGKCQLIIRSGKNPGNIEIQAQSEGLIDGSLLIRSTSMKKLMPYILLFFLQPVSGQDFHEIQGRLVDSTNNSPLSFGQVSLYHTMLGTTTNEDGVFRLDIPSANLSDTLLFYYLGYETRRVSVKDFSGISVEIRLKPVTLQLPEVEVVGLTPKK